MTILLKVISVSMMAVLFIHATIISAQNMNMDYKIANSETYSSKYDSEYFEVYSPLIKSQYSQVVWRMLDPVALPKDIIERFENKVMAVVGYEVDQVRKTPSGDVSVPITWAYNHHYCAWLTSRKTRLVKKSGSRHGMGHEVDSHWEPIVKGDEDGDSEIPLSHFFSEGNGGEFRGSYHGYPKGYAQVIESPNTFHVSPMQIDTWNREMVDAKFMPGPLPKNSRIPPNAGYSGLLECPCNDQTKKKWAMTYALETSDKCDGAVQNASECFSGARQVVQADNFSTKEISDPANPLGCFVLPHTDGGADIIWNTGKGLAGKGLAGQAYDLQDSQVVAFVHSQVNLTVAMESGTVTITMVGPADKWFGTGFGSDTMCMHKQSDECPTGGPYAIVVIGDKIIERKLGFHGPGTVLEPSVTVKTNVVQDGNRRVVLTRSLDGSSSQHYSFDPSVNSVPIVAARGCGLTFAKHCGHAAADLNFLAVGVPVGICESGISGTVGGNRFSNKRCAPFPRSDLKAQNNPTCSIQTYRGGLYCCHDDKLLLDSDQENPWAGQYLEYHLKFRFYFEEYKAPSTVVGVPSHKNLVRLLHYTEGGSAGEYDIVKCKDDVPRSQCVQVITSRWKVRSMMNDCSTRPDGGWCTGAGSTNANITDGVQLIYAGPHCHAPSCLSMELYNADTGRLICRVEPMYGQSGEVFDEHGFLALPPCLWGEKSEGLQAPELLSLDTTLLSIKRNNNTLGHTGDMAIWQMRGVVVPKKKLSTTKDQVASTESVVITGRRGRLRRMEGGGD